MSDTSGSWWARLALVMFGRLRYEPPEWLPRCAAKADDHLRRNPGRYAGAIVIAGALAVMVPQILDHLESRRPQPRQLAELRQSKGSLSMPGVTRIVRGKPQPQPLTLRFDASTAPLNAAGKSAAGVTLAPEHEGAWTWGTDKLLVFTPAKDWPAGQEFTVRLDPAELPPEVALKETSWTGRTPALKLEQTVAEFQMDPRDPSLQNVVVGFKSTHPLDREHITQLTRLEVLGGARIFEWKGRKPDALFSVTEGAHQREFWIRTARIQVPEKEDFLKVTLSKSLTSTLGGAPLGDTFTAKVRVPDIESGFKIAGVETSIIKTEDGEPEQFIFINTEGYATGENMAKHLGVWQEPPNFTVRDALGSRVTPGPNDVTEAVLAQYTPVALKPVETGVDEGQPATTRHAFKFLTEQRGRLFVRVTKGVEGLGGFRLGGEFRVFGAPPSFPKEVQLLGQGGILALHGERKLSLQSRGAPFLRVTMARVPQRQINHLVVMTEGDFATPHFRASWVFDESNLARFLRRVQPVPMKNDYQAAYSTLDFAGALQSADPSDTDASRGLFFLTAEGVKPYTGSQRRMEGDGVAEDWQSLDEDASTRRFVLVTDLGLLVKKNADGSRDVFVQSIQTGDPVDGATITVLAKNGEHLLQAATINGHAHLAATGVFQREKQPVAIVASLGNDVSFLPFERPDRLLDFSRFDTGGVLASENDALEAFLFTERGVYRPGDDIHIGAVLKRRDWAPGLAGLPLEVDLINARDEVASTQKVVLGADGFVEVKMKTDEAAPTGRHIARLYLIQSGNHRIQLGQTVLRVEDFQPDRMKIEVALTGNELDGWLQPGSLHADVTLQTLFGFPAAKRLLKAGMELSPGDFAFQQFPGYIFHNRLPVAEDDESLAGQKVGLGEQTTDDEGKARFDLALERFDQGCFQVSLLIEGFEADGGRSVRAGRQFLVAALPYVVGHKPDGGLGYLGKDSDARTRFLAVGPDLKPLAPPDLTARLIHIRHVSVLTQQESGSHAYVSTRRESQLSEAPFTLPAEGADYTLPTDKAGDFRLELRDAESRVVCAVPFTVVGKGDMEHSLERDTELGIKLARDTWAGGENLEAALSAAYTGAGLLTIERERVLGWQWFKAGTPATVQTIRVPDTLEGSAYVSASFVRGLDSKEFFASPLSHAVAHFTANPDKRRIQVTLDAPEKVRPGDELKIGFQAARPCRVVIYAVDAGIHQITDYKLPDALAHLNRKRALETETEQLMDLILPEFSHIARHKAFGGDADKPLRLNLNPFKRRKEPPVVFWSGLIAAGPDRREVGYTVPDYFAGRLNIMAVAVAEDAAGRAETSSIARGPLVLTPNAPFFAAPGDEFTASLTVANNLEGAEADAPVRVIAQVTPHLEIIESPQGEVHVPPGREETVRFLMRALEEPGGAEITFKAEAAGQTVLRRATLSVRPASPYLTHVQSGWFRDGPHDVKVTREMHPHHRKLHASVSALPLGLARGLETYLSEYPYGCSEQITSRAVSRLILSGEADFGFDPAESARQLDTAFALLRSRQHSGGGFGYWDSTSSGGMDYLSTYVTRFLTEARDAGHAVPSALLEGARKHMREMARGTPGSLDDSAVQAAAVYLLTRHGENTSAFVLNLRDHLRQHHDKTWRAHLTAAYLAGAYALLKQQNEGATLMRGYWDAARNDSAEAAWRGGWHLDPQVSRAEGFAVLCRHFPEIAGAFRYQDLEVIIGPLASNRFNTISAATTIMALKAYSDLARESGISVSLSELPRHGGPALLIAPEKTGLIQSPFSAQAGALRFGLSRQDGADLGAFYQVTESGFDKTPPRERIADGLEVTREILGADGGAVAKLKVGEAALVRLSVRNVSSAALQNIAVLDLMPGSFELEPNGLRPGRGTMPGADYVDVREDRNIFFCSLEKGGARTFAYRVKPIAAGVYAIPPAFAESMYDRSLKGRDGGGSVTVE